MIERPTKAPGIERTNRRATAAGPQQDIGLIDLIDRLLDGGVVLAGESRSPPPTSTSSTWVSER